jgi:hypothetical protein
MYILVTTHNSALILNDLPKDSQSFPFWKKPFHLEGFLFIQKVQKTKIIKITNCKSVYYKQFIIKIAELE